MNFAIVVVSNVLIFIQAHYFGYSMIDLLTVYLLEVPLILLFSCVKTAKIDGGSGFMLGFLVTVVNGIFLFLGFLAVKYIACMQHSEMIVDFDQCPSIVQLISDVAHLEYMIAGFCIIQIIGLLNFFYKKEFNKLEVFDLIKFNSFRSVTVVITCSILGSVLSRYGDIESTAILWIFIVIKLVLDVFQAFGERRKLVGR